jgi:hypothetical protein
MIFLQSGLLIAMLHTGRKDKKMIKFKENTAPFVVILVLVLSTISSCKTVTTAAGEKVEPFKGTIVYDVEVIQTTDTLYEKNKKALFGNEMYLTIYKNGDIQRKYNGASNQGYDLQYLDVKQNELLVKFNYTDSLFVQKANIQNIKKLNDLRDPATSLNVMNYDLQELSVAAQQAPSANSVGKYLTIKYWYSDALHIDKSLYTNVNNDLWGYFMSKSDGSLFLKYEIDFFTYKVIYTAKEIRPGKYENAKEKMNETAPRVTN